MNILNKAKEVFEIESRAISNLANIVTSDFEKAVYAILNTNGKVIISGMGKSGLIGKKIAATLSSTGTSSFFLHPGEAYHGDLGMIEEKDILLLLSNSGETDEILKIIPFLKNQGNTIISITGKPDSTLAKNSNHHLNVYVEQEACPLSLAPTSSTTATLVMGDALAVTLMKLRDFQDQDFAKFHPGGSLGRKLLTKVKDIMTKTELPKVTSNSDFREIIETMTTGRLGLCVVYNDNNIVGIITDGDLRRALRSNDKSRFDFIAKEIMTEDPKFTTPDQMADKAEQFMIEHKINELLVIEKGELLGIVQLFDIGNIK